MALVAVGLLALGGPGDPPFASFNCTSQPAGAFKPVVLKNSVSSRAPSPSGAPRSALRSSSERPLRSLLRAAGSALDLLWLRTAVALLWIRSGSARAASHKRLMHAARCAQKGMEATFIPYGATCTHLVVPDKTGHPRDVILGWDDPTNYCAVVGHSHVAALAEHTYFGATIGRIANRIAKGTFSIGTKDRTWFTHGS